MYYAQLTRFIVFAILIAGSACLSPHDPSAVTEEERLHMDSEKAVEFARETIPENEQQGLAAKTPGSGIEVKVFSNVAPEEGFGYDILMDGNPYIHQASIPSVPGNRGFSSHEKAIKAAEFVIYKIKNNIMPPAVNERELDSLGVLD